MLIETPWQLLVPALLLVACELPLDAMDDEPDLPVSHDMPSMGTAMDSVEGTPGIVAYLVQSIQSTDGNVPLQAGRDAMLRIFPTDDDFAAWPLYVATRFDVPDYTTELGLPSVIGATRGRIYHGRDNLPAASTWICKDSDATYTLNSDTIYGGTLSAALPDTLQECDLWSSLNLHVPGSVVRPGMIVEVEINDGIFSHSVRLVPEVLRPHRVSLALVPIWSADSGSNARLRTRISSIEEKSLADPYLFQAAHALPIDLSVSILDLGNVVISPGEVGQTDCQAFTMLNAMRDSGFERDPSPFAWYYAVYDYDAPEVAELDYLWSFGCGSMGGTTGAGVLLGQDPDYINFVLAHELGHMMSLGHATCKNPIVPTNEDPHYPNDDGFVGHYGYFFPDRLVQRRDKRDLMSYCREGQDLPLALGDYYWSQALRFISRDANATAVRGPEVYVY